MNKPFSAAAERSSLGIHIYICRYIGAVLGCIQRGVIQSARGLYWSYSNCTVQNAQGPQGLYLGCTGPMGAAFKMRKAKGGYIYGAQSSQGLYSACSGPTGAASRMHRALYLESAGIVFRAHRGHRGCF